MVVVEGKFAKTYIEDPSRTLDDGDVFFIRDLFQSAGRRELARRAGAKLGVAEASDRQVYEYVTSADAIFTPEDYLEIKDRLKQENPDYSDRIESYYRLIAVPAGKDVHAA